MGCILPLQIEVVHSASVSLALQIQNWDALFACFFWLDF